MLQQSDLYRRLRSLNLTGLRSAAASLLRLTTSRLRHRKWEDGIASELEFWRSWFATRGLQWPDEYRERLRADLPLSDYHYGFLSDIREDPIKILDVGAGPLTVLGKTHPEKRLLIVPTDALATWYDELLTEFSITPPVRTILAPAERLLDSFSPNSFHLVNARNCLDHSRAPWEAIKQMIAVVKPGRFVLLNHAENEGETQRYVGMHQWNFTLTNGEFIIRSRNGAQINVSRMLDGLAVLKCNRLNELIRVHIQKTAASGLSFDPATALQA